MLSYLIQLLFSILPDTRLYPFKAFLLRLRKYEIGENVRVVSSAKIKVPHLKVGDNTFISHDTLISGGNAWVIIGQNVDIAPRCSILTGSHEIGDATHRAGKGKSTDIFIGDGTWVGAGSIILGGISIGKGCMVAAGSLVRENIPDNSLIAGVPAKIIRQLD